MSACGPLPVMHCQPQVAGKLDFASALPSHLAGSFIAMCSVRALPTLYPYVSHAPSRNLIKLTTRQSVASRANCDRPQPWRYNTEHKCGLTPGSDITAAAAAAAGRCPGLQPPLGLWRLEWPEG
jgi:hypothetical protein